MQKGNLKSFSCEKKSHKHAWMQWLNPLRYMPDRLWKDFLEAYTGLKKGLGTYYYYHIYPEVNNLPIFSAIKIKQLQRSRTKTEKIDLKSMQKLSYSLDFGTKPLKIKSGLTFEHKTKWVLLNFKRILNIKSYNIKIVKKPRNRAFKNFDLTQRLTKKIIPKELFVINKNLNSKEALIEICPYVQSISKNILYSLPIEKPAMNKKFIELPLLEKFKQKLSNTAQVKPHEIKFLSAYQNLQIELYKDLKHNAKKDTLMCYLDENKRHIANPKSFYLVFGQRLADQKIFTIVCEN